MRSEPKIYLCIWMLSLTGSLSSTIQFDSISGESTPKAGERSTLHLAKILWSDMNFFAHS